MFKNKLSLDKIAQIIKTDEKQKNLFSARETKNRCNFSL